METFTGKIRIANILRDQNNWQRFLAWKDSIGVSVREAVRYHVGRALACRTPVLGFLLLACTECNTLRVVPHSCKSRFCSSCATSRISTWSRQLLSDLLDVPYRHLIFTIPYELRLLIRDNRKRLEDVMFRAARDALLAMTLGDPFPLCRKAQERMNRSRKRYLPGFQIGLHTFGSDLKINPHLHMMVSGGGLSPDRSRWLFAPVHSLVSGNELATEWKLRLITYIAAEHDKLPLYCRRLKCDPNRNIEVDKLLGHIRKMTWHVRIGPSLEDPTRAVLYCARYSRRPALGETRIVKYDGQHVTFYYKDYHNGGKRAYRKKPVLKFIDALVEHIPEKGARHFRSYGLFAPRCKKQALAVARKLLEQRKRPRPRPLSWLDRRKQAGELKPLRCPHCKAPMEFFGNLFGSHRLLAQVIGLNSPGEPISYPLYIRLTGAISALI
jgi:hypothetical protein